VSVDQTTRIHSKWNKSWREIARPQVHGHNLSCVTSLPGHGLASGAEEKVTRTFEATKSFLSSLSRITKTNFSDEMCKLSIEGASVPSLGLSNRPVKENDQLETENKR